MNRQDIEIAGVRITDPDGFKLTTGPMVLLVTLNAELLLLAQSEPRFAGILRHADTRVTVDGQWILWALRRKYGRCCSISKGAGSDIVYLLPNLCRSEGLRLFILGSDPRANAIARERMANAAPGLAISGYSPQRETYPFSAASNQAIIDRLAAFRPDILVCAFGAPKEQFWADDMRELLRQLGVRMVLLIGGAVDMYAGTVGRAPIAMQQLGLEGLYRVAAQPGRLWRFLKVLRFLPIFLFNRY